MRIEEMLQMPPLRDAGIEVLAGAQHLDREVGWVHTGEIADIAQYLSGGEVLLTAATGLARDAGAQRRYIAAIAEVGAAAVIIELGRQLTSVPRTMIDEANRRGLVLISLSREVPFVGVTQAVHTALIASSHAALVRAMEIDDALSELILDGAPLQAFLELLSERLANPVVLEDAAHRVVAFGRASGAIGPILRTWPAHSRSAHASPRGAGVHISESERRCAWCDISLRGDLWGRLHVLEVDSALDDVTRLAMGRAASTIALQLMLERDAMLSDEVELTLLRRLTSEQEFNGQEFIDRASGLGIAFSGDLIVLATSPAAPRRGAPEPDDPVGSLVQATRDALATASWPAVVGVIDGVVVVVAGTGIDGGWEAAAARVAERLADAPAPPQCLGVSRPGRASALPRAFQEARAAHRLAPAAPGVHVQLYDELALHRLLSPLMGGPELATFVEGELGELVAYDEEHNSDLVRTLDVYLQANGNKITTASMLYLRRRSVYYRLERIEQVLGCSLDSHDRRARLYLALRARELLNDRPTAEAST